jgi:hypothetical protein
MKLSTIQKLGGISLIVGSILFAAWSILWPTLLPFNERMRDFTLLVLNRNWIWINAMVLPGVILMLFGFTAAYSRFYSEAGILGFIGFIFIVLAYILQSAQLSWEIFLYPILASYTPSAPLFKERILVSHSLFQIFRWLFDSTIFLGVMTFGIALIRSKQFHKSIGYLIISGALIYAIGPMIHILIGILGVLILAFGCLLLGLALTKEQIA